jgi:hypothetical protein
MQSLARPVAAPSRILDLRRKGLADAPEPWELPGDAADLKAYGSLRRAAYAFIPADLRSPELPGGAVETLAASVGALQPGSVILLPRTPRSVGPRSWVVTPACVLGIGADALALWVGAPVDGVVARIPLAEVAAIVDLTVLLFGRLEIVGPEGSIVLRYNTVGREEIRSALAAIRRSWPSPGEPRGTPAGPRPEDLPHKWMALLRSREMLPGGPQARLVAAGAVADPKATRRNGLATLSGTELLVVTEPDTPGGSGAYGTDLVAVPRARLAHLSVTRDRIEAVVASGRGEVRLRIPAHPTLAAAVGFAIAPAVG